MVTRSRHRRMSIGRQLLTTRAFVVVYLAETQSIIGDQLARFALSVLVFDRTQSASAAALTYAVSFLPAILGGFALGGLGDRFPKRAVMVLADLLRASAFLGMAVPGESLSVIVGLLAVAVFLGPAFNSAEVSYLAAALDEETFRAATAMRSASSQLAQVLGFAVGGAIVLALHPRGALVVNAATFVLSAGLIAVGLAGKHVSGSASEALVAKQPGDVAFKGLWRDARTRSYMCLLVVVGLFVLPESLAVPFGDQIGASTVQTGLLVATIPLGSAIGALIVVRIRPDRRSRTAGAMAVLCGIPLLASALGPMWLLAGGCWLLSGLFGAYQVEVITGLVSAIPEAVRSHRVGQLGSWLLGAQGLGFALGGLLTEALEPGAAIAVAAAAGSCLAAAALVATAQRASPAAQSAM